MLQRNRHRSDKETGAMKNLFQTIRQWQQRNSTVKMLGRWDDYMLSDIGITRGDLRKSVHIFH
jgi:uncharacterized protein YjiS (DUF1127 family)